MIALLVAIAVSVVLSVTIMRREISRRLRDVIVEMDAKRTKDFLFEAEQRLRIHDRINGVVEDYINEDMALASALGYEKYVTLAGPRRTGYMKKTTTAGTESRPYPN